MNIVFCGSKSILNADYLIDDNARHFEKFNGEAILFSAPHNKHVTGFHRVKNWLEIESFFTLVSDFKYLQGTLLAHSGLYQDAGD